MWKIRKFLLVSMMFVVVFSYSISVNAMVNRLAEDEVQFTFISLPDGEALLITTGRGKEILVNTGSENSEEHLQKQLEEELESAELDMLIITSNEGDTCGNANYVLKNYKVGKVIHSSDDLDCLGSDWESEEIQKWEDRGLYELSPGLFFRVLKGEKVNRMSLYIQFGKSALFFMSEGSREIENVIRDFPVEVEMIKVPEYAVKNYPSGELLQELDPHLAIIYNLKESKLHDGLLERLNESWIDVYHLKKVGTIKIVCNLSDYEIKK
ncbi:beta-lactamase superfamily II metal-dependent hydrolase [Salirhabdus euzebyi]|uniref:Beta-lactamase superfamily II metal-dependent hydrolase n=1 Tax=Salirhabdus euzebyi TaxID=394506 RepID=A0A841PWJ1_9BACI|nr:hypothetical protein [Salirhabdus euzebyi]MBB6452234.1 beta-lactamase superfamily II metal-dependent hydrolase [Salirhabdus euzebyi]